MNPVLATLCGPGDATYLTNTFIDWFTGYGRYSTLTHCMGADWGWIAGTVTLDLSVAVGYLLIAKHWWSNERTLPDIPARKALANMRNIFLFCGICGYMFIPIKMFWPAWRLYDLVMLVLVYFTWKYAWGAKDLKVIYAEIGRGNRLEKELEASRDESRKKSFFLNAVSHDLRTPLNGLMLQSRVAEMSVQANDLDGLHQALHDIRTSAAATANLLDSLLDYARLEWAADSNVDCTFSLAESLDQVIGQHRVAASDKGLTLKVSVPAGLQLTADRMKFERVVTNLVSNAVKFTPAGTVRVEVESAGRAVELHVIDTGIGISPESRARLFEEFYQGHNHERDRRKGFGLGLAIALRLARQLGGDLCVDSAVGKGSRFTLSLPDAVRTEPGRIESKADPVAVNAV